MCVAELYSESSGAMTGTPRAVSSSWQEEIEERERRNEREALRRKDFKDRQSIFDFLVRVLGRDFCLGQLRPVFFLPLQSESSMRSLPPGPLLDFVFPDDRSISFVCHVFSL